MPVPLRIAIIAMALALACYTAGVWGERFARHLRPWHAVFFWAGFAADTVGTEMMRRIAGGLVLNLHTVTGIAALAVMFGHAIWATTVLVRHDEARARRFHRLSVVVWCIWLVPFVSGMFQGMVHA
jgi:uncharacterized repeat protein (TIGR03987 family)